MCSWLSAKHPAVSPWHYYLCLLSSFIKLFKVYQESEPNFSHSSLSLWHCPAALPELPCRHQRQQRLPWGTGSLLPQTAAAGCIFTMPGAAHALAAGAILGSTLHIAVNLLHTPLPAADQTAQPLPGWHSYSFSVPAEPRSQAVRDTTSASAELCTRTQKSC